MIQAPDTTGVFALLLSAAYARKGICAWKDTNNAPMAKPINISFLLFRYVFQPNCFCLYVIILRFFCFCSCGMYLMCSHPQAHYVTVACCYRHLCIKYADRACVRSFCLYNCLYFTIYAYNCSWTVSAWGSCCEVRFTLMAVNHGCFPEPPVRELHLW